MANALKIQQSAEDYLEAMLILREKRGYIRSVDIARELNFSKPSVSIAVKKLRENGYLSVDEDGLIRLTESGEKIAESTYARHKLLTEILVKLGVDEATAREDACRIEHDISEASFSAIKKHSKKLLGK
jgi:Mn-dependent DtxR family transcriptional regulator